MIFEIRCLSCNSPVETYKNPFPTVDILLIENGSVLLIERKNPPSGWAIPGGFVDYGESTETCAARELKEETGLNLKSLDLLGVYSAPGRDPRFHTLTVVYLGKADGTLQAGDDASAATWFPLDKLPAEIAFDHRQVIQDGVARLASRS